MKSLKKITFNSNHRYKISPLHHILFWASYFSLNTWRWGTYFNDFNYSLKTNIIGFPLHMITCYLTIYILVPNLIFKKKYITFFLALLTTIFLTVIAKFNLTYYLVSSNVWPEGPTVTSNFTLSYAIDMMIGELYVVTFVAAIKITFDFLEEHKRVTDLEKANLETELLFLKTQISPHFFFNTLNNIHSLALEKSNKTSKIILKLSELMRYLLYETKQKRQTLENEILCIQNYLDLEKVRHDDSLEVNMSISGDIQDKKIAPILLLSFIENAFKHGVNKNIGNTTVDISFEIKENFLYFTVSNPMPSSINQENHVNYSGGIGLKNVRKRLALGYKKGDYDLNFEESNNTFYAKLKIRVS
ncbi:GHKL domain-containing protein [Seonamhaeicola sediminis]|uniref:GHKL domain-containing protein n=1 Tax=Seonamhaeicola sediminis TaxID=2528206 RepID=A0A562YIB0_9FLAO|nr:histidine kinase [Seonamhaeicola sediminis]TWO34704.1 GHKL domain-containing protein [Seonamhaeicola sediminis]